LYALAIPLSMWHAWLGCAIDVFVAILVPERRIETRLAA
jgi:hypothetical protein